MTPSDMLELHRGLSRVVYALSPANASAVRLPLGYKFVRQAGRKLGYFGVAVGKQAAGKWTDIIFVHRGTQVEGGIDWNDVRTDLMIISGRNPVQCDQARAFIKSVLEALAQDEILERTTIHNTGHSLGGALAVIGTHFVRSSQTVLRTQPLDAATRANIRVAPVNNVFAALDASAHVAGDAGFASGSPLITNHVYDIDSVTGRPPVLANDLRLLTYNRVGRNITVPFPGAVRTAWRGAMNSTATLAMPATVLPNFLYRLGAPLPGGAPFDAHAAILVSTSAVARAVHAR